MERQKWVWDGEAKGMKEMGVGWDGDDRKYKKKSTTCECGWVASPGAGHYP
jgi:hypothetical protein